MEIISFEIFAICSKRNRRIIELLFVDLHYFCIINVPDRAIFHTRTHIKIHIECIPFRIVTILHILITTASKKIPLYWCLEKLHFP